MSSAFDIIVIGAGMMGSAAARHLVEMGAKVALIGPDEPSEKQCHQGVFASHYDQARITRRLDEDPVWSRFADAAMRRYAEIEHRGKQAFLTPVGAMMAGPESGAGSDFIAKTKQVAKDHAIPHLELREEALAAHFPYLSFPTGVTALYELDGAGWINPRLHVRAEINIAVSGGAILHRSEAFDVMEDARGVAVKCKDGTTWSGGKVIVACGAFSIAEGLLPDPLPMKVFARTIAFLEIGPEECRRLKGMPSIVYVAPDGSCEPYILPPVCYPDGKSYLKIGGDLEDIQIETHAELREWFRGSGNRSSGDFLAKQLLRLMPGLDVRSITTGSCATSYSPTGMPFIYHQTDHIMALTAGNGAGAKCADELGRLGAYVASGKPLPEEYGPISFGW
ncbi:NAD(P)/FAD-dependent oxidoreductase [Histidinibacterium aquaticum]|uniref:FAD-binding oxidoreductase n=1 Tax=Histidinibacterium aquaticum TaxID=2613962 RepID=A0A5J5GL66_9RHOB|nr:FAD-binding oxidoreductase [Histidinibacterium aquaticum]KAA9008777.1 FAD-binding oxidoreductase [Histidinibacterium aquaticum]